MSAEDEYYLSGVGFSAEDLEGTPSKSSGNQGNIFSSIFGTIGQAYGANLNAETEKERQRAATQQAKIAKSLKPATSTTPWGLITGIGLGVVVLLVVVFAFTRGK